MDSRIVAGSRYVIRYSARIIMRYFMPGMTRLSQYVVQSIRTAVITTPALPAAPAPLLLMPPPAAESPQVGKKKKRRDKTDFSTNVTASIALAKKQMKTEGPLSYLSSIGTYASSAAAKLFTKTQHAQPMPLPIDTTRAEMEALESQLVGHADPDSIILRKVEMVSEQVRQHAMMRVDLFFYLLLLVRGTHVIVSKDETVKQHGNGSKEAGTQACHSSLFPNIKLETSSNNLPDTSWSMTLFSPATNRKPNTISLKGTHFEETLNITYELPGIVNGFDGHLEGRFQPTVYVKECLEIINKVSRYEIDIVTGMNMFFKTMNAFFTHMEYDYIKKPNKLDYPKSFKRVWECEKAGTFFAARPDNLTLDDNYLYMMLRINNRADRLKCMTSSRFLTTYYDAIQKELFESKSDYAKKSNLG